jgi:gas vesicle structural protein
MSAVPVSVVRSTPASSGLYDVLDLILDKGLVIDAYVRVSVIGIELLTIDLRVVIASVDTYLRFAEAVDRLYLHEQGGKSLADLTGSNGNGKSKDRDEDSRKGRELGEGDDNEGGRVRSGMKRVKEKVRGRDDGDEPDEQDEDER